jgi:hypothetical protein
MKKKMRELKKKAKGDSDDDKQTNKEELGTELKDMKTKEYNEEEQKMLKATETAII